MIKDVLNTVIISLNKYIYAQIYTSNSEDLHQSDQVVILGNLAERDNSSEESLDNRVIISIINIQQEGLIRNIPNNNQIYNSVGLPSGISRNDGVYLTIYIVIGANYKVYETAIDRISDVITFFQKKPVFNLEEISTFKKLNLDKIIFEIYSTSFEEINNFWGIMGGKYVPSVVYKMQMPVLFIESPKKISIDLTQKEFCENDRKIYTIATNPNGGTLFINNRIVEDQQFIPKLLGAGTHSIIYEFEELRESISIKVSSIARSNIAIGKISHNTPAGWDISFLSEPVPSHPLRWRIVVNGSEYQSEDGSIRHLFPADASPSGIELSVVNSLPCPPSYFKKGLNFHHEKISICKRTNAVYNHPLAREKKVILVTNQDGISAEDNVINLQFENIVILNNQDLTVAVYQETEIDFYFSTFIFEILDASFSATFELLPKNNPRDNEFLMITLIPTKKGGKSEFNLNGEITEEKFKYPVNNLDRLESLSHSIKFRNLECSDYLKKPINVEKLRSELRSRGKSTILFN